MTMTAFLLLPLILLPLTLADSVVFKSTLGSDLAASQLLTCRHLLLNDQGAELLRTIGVDCRNGAEVELQLNGSLTYPVSIC